MFILNHKGDIVDVKYIFTVDNKKKSNYMSKAKYNISFKRRQNMREKIKNYIYKQK